MRRSALLSAYFSAALVVAGAALLACSGKEADAPAADAGASPDAGAVPIDVDASPNDDASNGVDAAIALDSSSPVDASPDSVWTPDSATFDASPDSAWKPDSATIDAAPIDAGSPDDDFLTRFATQQCAQYVPCCNAAGHALDSTTCIASAKAPLLSYYSSVMSAGDYHYDSAQGDACVARIKAQQNGCETGRKYAVVTGHAGDNPCLHVYSGFVATGGACSREEDCALIGGRTVYCQISGGIGKCEVEGQAGESCVPPPGTSRPRDCEPGLYCSGNAGTTCQPTHPAGATVEALDGCTSGVLVLSTMTCLTAEPHAGGPCAYPIDCADDAYCGANSVCVARAQPGAACGTTQCVYGATCVNGVCVAGVGGSACQSNDQCMSFSCENGTCDATDVGVGTAATCAQFSGDAGH
jgi:hypothetical protein